MLPYLEQNGFSFCFSYLISEKDDKFFYKKGNYLKKLGVLFRSITKRFNDILKSKKFDLVFVQREAIMLGTAFFERYWSKKLPLIFDFDDSIWLPNVSEANKSLAFLKSFSKTSKLISIADLVFAGNQYLADYALKYNNSVVIIPTTIDTEEYQRKNVVRKYPNKVCIGWSGSITTIQHFEFVIPALIQIKKIFGEKVYFKVIGDASYFNKELEIKGLPWIKKDEINDLSEIDIGLMPLPDDEWAKGKCGLKGLQYMALEIPTIMSPVGVNTEIIQDGVNGFLADSTEEWVNKLSLLIENKELREKLGKEGRKTVEQKYSKQAWQDKYLQYFNELLERSSR